MIARHPAEQATARARARMRLSVRGPVVAGICGVAVLATAVGIAARMPFEKNVGLAGVVVADATPRPVRLARSGIVERLHVAVGQNVAAGEVLASLETRALAEELGSLRAQAEASEQQLHVIRGEVEQLLSAGQPAADARVRVAALEAQLLAIEKDGVGLTRRTAIAEQELAKAVIRAPVAGRILRLASIGAGEQVAGGMILAEIAPSAPAMSVLATLPDKADFAAGTPARVWPLDLPAAQFRPYRGRAAGPSGDHNATSLAGQRTLQFHIGDGRASFLSAGMPVRLSIATGAHSMLDELIAPVVRLLNRAPRA